MTREFTPAEEAWIRAELVRDPRLLEDTLRTLLRARHRAQREAEDEQKAARDAGVSLAAYRQAKAERAAEDVAKAREAELGTARRAVQVGRRRGRPKGSRTHSKQAIVSKFRELRTNFGRNPKQQELADNLDPRIEIRTLQDHLDGYGLPWPIE